MEKGTKKSSTPKPEPRNFTDVGLNGILGERQLIAHKKKDKKKEKDTVEKSSESKMTLSMDDFKVRTSWFVTLHA